MDLLTVITLLIITSAAFAYLNERFVGLPGTIGVVTVSVVVSLIILVAGKTSNGITDTLTNLARSIDFSKVLLDVMLGALLFAGAIHFDYQALKKQRRTVLLLSTLGVMVSAGVFGLLYWLATGLLGINMPLVYCFLFGALISPTDPIAVTAIFRKSTIPARLNTIISGESLFNDAVGLLLFVTFLGLINEPGMRLTASGIFRLFFREVLGGIAIGIGFGWIGFRMMRAVSGYQTIFLISLALVLGISVVAGRLHASIPLAAVTAGLVVGQKSLSGKPQVNEFLGRIWQLLDEVLNTILFVMIGLQLVVMPFLNNYWIAGLAAIASILLARAASVSLPALFWLRRLNFGTLAVLTWAGLRGGISIAMAMSLPPSPYRELILSACYFIVIFSIIVQGLTLDRLIKRTAKP